jgi:hypothetical protein
VGRDAELEAIRAYWRDGFRGVLALVGLGGAGKTAVAARFLEGLHSHGVTPQPHGLFVWSFHQQPDAGLFLQEAFRYFASRDELATAAKGSGILHLLHGALATGGPHLVVLDGVERVQRQVGTEDYGCLEDPLLKGLLTRLAEGVGRATVLVTSRFPLTDLTRQLGQGYRLLDVGGIDPDSARALLRSRGVTGDDATLNELIDAYGSHALTLDHLGGVIGQFLGGDPHRAPEAPALSGTGGDRQALRLARLLRAYEDHLPPAELALLCRMCLLRRNLTEEQIRQLFQCSPAVQAHTIREVTEQIRRLPVPAGKMAPDLDDFARWVGRCLEEMLSAGSLAGPEDVFRQDVLSAVAQVVESLGSSEDPDFTEVARLYATAEFDVESDLRPLPAENREALRELCARYLELRAHQLMPFKGTLDPALEQAFEKLGWKKLGRRHRDDMRPDDLLFAYKQVRRRLWHLTGKHFILRRVRELCAASRRKWSLAGPLAPLDVNGLRAVLEALVGRHLVVCESGGALSVHPAVRDYFHRLAVAPEQVCWHDSIREQLVSLIRQPGLRRPEDTVTLDLVEETIYHALQAGRTNEAEWLYREVLGGMRHLAWKLGETARGLRILRCFDPCPDLDALAWFLRALGELDKAYTRHPMPYFRADIRLLQGRLPQVAADGDDVRSATAAFLMGRVRALPRGSLGCAVPRDQLLLYLGRPGMPGNLAEIAAFYQDIGWEGDRTRLRLLQAEAAQRWGDLDGCRGHLNAASGWILHSGSVEHLCLWNQIRARAARTAGDSAASDRAVEDGLHLALRCGLGLSHIELLCDKAELALISGDTVAAEGAARDALVRATAKDCQFLWGAAEAGHLLGQSLAAREEFRSARPVLKEALELRRQLGDPKMGLTEGLLHSVERHLA